MKMPITTRRGAPRRYTSAALTIGVVVAAVCFTIAFAAEVAGVEPGSGEMTDASTVIEGLGMLTPWAWATLGSYAVLVTPVVGLVITAWEYSTISDRRMVFVAVAVVAVLASSAVVSILR